MTFLEQNLSTIFPHREFHADNAICEQFGICFCHQSDSNAVSNEESSSVKSRLSFTVED